MVYGPPPQLDPNKVQALLAGWYDLVGPAVGHWPGYGAGFRGPYGGRLAAAAYNPYMMGQDPAAAPVVAPPPPPMMAPPMMAPPMGLPFGPRAALVDAPLPTQANRDILPMSTGVPILPTQSAQITGRPQTIAFKANTYKISNAGTAGGAADWIVNNILIGNRSQFVQSGDVPGDVFATNAVDTFVRFETAQTAMDIVVVVTYIGLNESGCPFFSAMIGTAAV